MDSRGFLACLNDLLPLVCRLRFGGLTEGVTGDDDGENGDSDTRKQRDMVQGRASPRSFLIWISEPVFRSHPPIGLAVWVPAILPTWSWEEGRTGQIFDRKGDGKGLELRRMCWETLD